MTIPVHQGWPPASLGGLLRRLTKEGKYALCRDIGHLLARGERGKITAMRGTEKLAGEAEVPNTMLPFEEFRKLAGYDLVGVPPMGCFHGLPPGEHPQSLFPDARSVVVVGSRIRRGEFRSMEKGSLWRTPTRWITSFDGLVRTIESQGYECVPYAPADAPRMPRRPVREGLCAPNGVRLCVEYAAAAAGLGEIGYHGMFLSERFGIRQRLGLLVTDMEVERRASVGALERESVTASEVRAAS